MTREQWFALCRVLLFVVHAILNRDFFYLDKFDKLVKDNAKAFPE